MKLEAQNSNLEFFGLVIELPLPNPFRTWILGGTPLEPAPVPLNLTPQELKHRVQCCAVLDAILCPEWEYRYYSFNSKWSPGREMGSMRDGCGDHFFCLFSEAGCAIKVRVHELPPLSELPELPAAFQGDFLKEPAFQVETGSSHLCWREKDAVGWQCSPERAAATVLPLFEVVEGGPQAYSEWAIDYYELSSLDQGTVQSVYEDLTIVRDPNLVPSLNPGVSLEALQDDFAEIGIPRC